LSDSGDGATGRMSVLVVTRNLPPLVGGMERLNFHVVDELAKECRVTVVGPQGCAAPLEGISRCVEVAVRPLWKFFVLSLWRALAAAAAERPQVVLAGSGLTAPIAWLAARLLRARCAVYLHGLDMIAPSFVYRTLWLPLIRRQDLCIVNSRYSRSLALSAGLPQHAIRVLNPGVAVPDAAPAAAAFRQAHGFPHNRLLLYVGRLTPRKGLLEFVQQVLPVVLADDPSLRLVVIGEEATDALAGGGTGYLARVVEAAEKAGIAAAVRFLGACPDQTLSAAYAAADTLIFPVIDRPGDAEGFGMVALEAAAHGTPTVAFAVGGLTDAVEDGISGSLVKPGDYAGFAHALQRAAADFGNDAARRRCREFAAGFRWEVFGARLRQMLTELCGAGLPPIAATDSGGTSKTS
jgi:phosphatidylinositol alpha-1,6-mannosyltransferase